MTIGEMPCSGINVGEYFAIKYFMEKSVSIKKAILAIILLGLTASAAVQAADAKFAFVDVQKVFAEANAAKAAQTSLSQKEAQYKKELEPMAANLQKIIESLQDSKITDTDKVDKAKDLKVKREEFRKTAADYEKKLNDERNSVTTDIMNALRQASQNIAKEKGYTAVLTSNQGLYYDKETDIKKQLAALQKQKNGNDSEQSAKKFISILLFGL